MQSQYKNKVVTVVGLGKTGLSCVDFLLQQQAKVQVMDTRIQPAGLEQLREDIPVHTGSLNQDWLVNSDLIVLSPGLALQTPEISVALAQGAEVVGDIELFCRATQVPIIAVTGSNGKSTVTTLVTEIAKQAGIKVGMGGNIGVPALTLLEDDYDLFVLELSSFQLETTYSLKALAATVLNVTEDHMDRYDSLEDYRQAKLRIYHNAQHIIVNGEDHLTYPDNPYQVISFAQQNGDYYVKDSVLYARQQPVLAVKDMNIEGRHNEMNALAAIALAEAAGISPEGIINGLKSYVGLEHRFQLVPTTDGVRWINDSKATNVGSTVAALHGLQIERKLYLLLGGDGKGADFSELKPLLNQPNILCYCFGRDGAQLAALTQHAVLVETMYQAIEQIRPHLVAGDMVLLSPACASLDQFRSFEHRGTEFARLASLN